MKIPQIPNNEQKRLKTVKSYNLLDSLPESEYDDITNLVATICDTPIALISLLDKDRNFFKSHLGIPFSESPRDISFCGHAILENDILIINDARKDERFMDNPLVLEMKAIFYAGVPLINPKGLPLGTLCVFDHRPRVLDEKQIKALKTLAKQVIQLFELRRKNLILNRAQKELKTRNEQLKRFASHVSHDLKSPLTNIISLTDLIRSENPENLSDDSNQYLDYIEESTTILQQYIEGMLMHYKSDELLKDKLQDVSLSELVGDIETLLTKEDDILNSSDVTIKGINKAALTQILFNLVDNALKYNDKAIREITIEYEALEDFHQFKVTDNGIGIPENKLDHIFEIFETVKSDFGKSSTGIGLSTVKNLVEKLHGNISVDSTFGKGSTFIFTIEK